MGNAIVIAVTGIRLRAELNDSPAAQAVYEALPIKASGNRWGEEIYFEIPVDAPLESDASEMVRVGELGFWPLGNAFCVFFGPTPASTGEEPVAASPVNRIGTV